MADLNVKLKIQGDSKQAEDSANRVSNALRGIEESGSKLNSTLSGLGFGVSLAGIGAFVKSGIDAADALNDLSDRTGIAIETLAGLDYAVKIGDTSIEAFATSIQRLSVNMGKYQDDFAQLGITAKDPIEAFKQLADVFSSIEDPQQRAAVGAAALGKSYAEMAPLLLQGADGIQALIDKGKEHNPVTAEQARLAGEFNDKLDELDNRMEHFSVIVAGPVIEALNGFSQAIQFATDVTDGFDPLSWLEAGSFGASGKAGQLEYLNRQIDDMTYSIQSFQASGKTANLLDTLFGNGSLGEQQRKLDALIAARDKLTKPATPAGKPQQAVNQDAVNKILRIKNDEEDKVEKSAKKSAAAIKSYASEIDVLNKKLLDTSAALEKSRPENLLQLNQIGATEAEKAAAREKALRDKAIEFDKANKKGDLSSALRIAQERETLAFQSANQDIYAARDGELPSYKIDDAKIKYKKAIVESNNALERFQKSGLGATDTPQSLRASAGATQQTEALQQSSLQIQISDAEKLKSILGEIAKPIKIDVSSNIAEQLAQAEALQQKLAAISQSASNANQNNAGSNGSVDQSLSTEVLKRGSRT